MATPRPPFGGGGGGDGDYVSFPFYGPWGSWYPWYTGYGWGYVGYNPWYYGATCWSWGIYGPWYNPYSYCWGSYYWPATAYYGVTMGGAGGGGTGSKPVETTGDVRVLASPKDANVYIDNALVGTVDEFDGLNSHLEIEGGRHTLTLKAEGYLPHSQEIVVEVGRTITARVKLKKVK